MIANTVKILRYCRSQPFSKCTPCLAHNIAHPGYNTVICISLKGPDSPLAGKNHSDVRAYVRQFNVIDNQRTLTQLSHGLEPPRPWKSLRDRKKKLLKLHQGWRTRPVAWGDHSEDPVVDHTLAWPGDPFNTVICGILTTAAAQTAEKYSKC